MQFPASISSVAFHGDVHPDQLLQHLLTVETFFVQG
jgi:hypothetical protein